MSDFFRPEAIAALRRWAETAGAAALALLGLWGALAGPGLVHLLGASLAALGAGLAYGAIQRARFAGRDIGTGLVEVIEGEIRYFGPRGGGVVALEALLALSLSADGDFWLVESFDGTILAIPRAASGHEALFDAFAALPGFDMARLLRITAQGPGEGLRPTPRLIWRHPDRRLLT